jgi:hypothetical protein
MMKVIAAAFAATVLGSSVAYPQSTVKDFMEAVTDEKYPKREVFLSYYSGVMDQTMNMGNHLKMWCFPQPMPSRVRLTQEFVADLGQLALEQGHEATLAMQLDQALLNRWGKRYLCKK